MRPPLRAIFRTATARPRGGRCAFTLIELVIGMIITTLILAAVGALMTSVARGWDQSISAQNGANTVFQLHLRLENLFRTARQIGAWRSGTIEGGGGDGAAVLFWKSDANGDGVIQYSEAALLEHRAGPTPGTCQLVLYQVQYPAGMTQAARDANDTPADSERDDWIYDKNGQSAIDQFKQLPYICAEPTVIAQYIAGCEFHVGDSTNTIRPTFNYLINIVKDGGGRMQTEYGSVAVRNAAALPLSQRGS